MTINHLSLYKLYFSEFIGIFQIPGGGYLMFGLSELSCFFISFLFEWLETDWILCLYVVEKVIDKIISRCFVDLLCLQYE